MAGYLKKTRDPARKKGFQSMRSLAKQGASLANAEITGDNIGSFKRIARKYNIDFALHKDTSETPPRWLVFFKSADGRAIDSAFEEFARRSLPEHKDQKQPLHEVLQHFKDTAKSLLAPSRRRERDGLEL